MVSGREDIDLDAFSPTLCERESVCEKGNYGKKLNNSPLSALKFKNSADLGKVGSIKAPVHPRNSRITSGLHFDILHLSF